MKPSARLGGRKIRLSLQQELLSQLLVRFLQLHGVVGSQQQHPHAFGLGVDFGTTNSSIARASAEGHVELARFPHSGSIFESYRSLLYLDQVKERGLTRIKSWSGPAAIEEYLSAETKGRLIQSLKSFLSSRSLKSTEVFGR